MTREAVIVVLFVTPSTRTASPVVTPLAGAAWVPCQYAVEDVVLMVTFCPAEVVSVNPEVDTLSTVPDDPPAAGPDRALDPPPPGMWWPDVAEADVAVVAVPEPVLAVALTTP
jgi:hypothetical protein